MEDQTINEFESTQWLYERINRSQGGNLKWWVEDKGMLKKFVLTDTTRKFRRALYIDKKKGRSDADALSDLVRGYCHDFELRY